MSFHVYRRKKQKEPRIPLFQPPAVRSAAFPLPAAAKKAARGDLASWFYPPHLLACRLLLFPVLHRLLHEISTPFFCALQGLPYGVSVPGTLPLAVRLNGSLSKSATDSCKAP